MAEDRIQIDGVWYVREETLDVINSISCLYENNDYCFDACRFINEDGVPSEHIFIDFIDKRTEPWKKEYWDNNIWLKNVYTNEPDAIKDARDSMCAEGVKTLQKFIGVLKEKNWL